MGSFKLGDRVNCPKIGVNGRVTAIDHFAGQATVMDDRGYGHCPPLKDLTLISAAATPMPTWSVQQTTYQELSDELERDTGWVIEKPKVCDCGAMKAKTTHATWCSAHESGGTVPYKRPAERLF